MKNIEKAKQGKKNRAAGARFERRVREDLESKGWIVSKWMNNVEIDKSLAAPFMEIGRRLIPAKHKFRGPGIPMAIGTGFPDFIAYKKLYKNVEGMAKIYIVMGVEVKSNGYLDKEEKEKCRWLLQNNKFSKILIASKGIKRGQIGYKEFVEDKK